MSTPGRCHGTAPHPAHNWGLADDDGLADYDCPGIRDQLADRSRAPWNKQQVASLNNYQESGAFHPFTCAKRDLPPHNGETVLHATADGWVCPSCSHTQNWAHSWMADDSWREWGIQELERG